jgi:hypothetical protein
MNQIFRNFTNLVSLSGIRQPQSRSTGPECRGNLQEVAVRTRRITKTGIYYAILALAFASGPAARATVVWNQGVNGPLSENPLAPTVFNLATGTNSVIATVGGGTPGAESGVNQNWLNINIPAGLQLSQYVLASFVSTDQQGFTGVASGATFAGGEAAVNTRSSYLGFSHYGTGAQNGTLPATSLVGQDLLPLMGNNTTISSGSLGFTPPLPAGAYTFLIQQTGATTNYQFDFDVTAVPEPVSGGLLLCSSLVFGLRRRTVRR